jgi:hypothetical protein
VFRDVLLDSDDDVGLSLSIIIIKYINYYNIPLLGQGFIDVVLLFTESFLFLKGFSVFIKFEVVVSNEFGGIFNGFLLD